MARIRTVKPELFRHEELFNAEKESGLPLRLAFIGLFTVCDRAGRFRWKPSAIKLDILPYDVIDIATVLDALVSYGFLVKYGLADHLYGCILSFPKHQVINNREKDSELPEYSEEFDASPTREPRVPHASTTRLKQDQAEGKGREGNKEGEGKGIDAGASRDKSRKQPLDYSCWPELPKEQTLADWIAMRKRIKADVSQTIINDFSTELHKAFDAGLTVDHCLAKCLSNNWRGFKYQWLLNQETSNAANKQPVKQSRGERHTQAHRDYIASLEQEEANSRLLAGSLGSPVGE